MSVKQTPVVPGTPAKPRILFVEDSIFVVMTLETMCEDLGWEMVGPAMRVDEGVALATTEQVDAALLDVDLAGEMSWSIAAVLRQRGVPFAFGTGHDIATVLPAEFAGSPFFSKPFRIAEVERQLRLLLGQRAAAGPGRS